MEKITSNLHREEIKCGDRLQFVVEEDKNISDQSPDIIKILMEEGELSIEEARPIKDGAELRGKLKYYVLYLTNEGEQKLNKISGEISWEEKVRVEGMEPTDLIGVEKSIEDIKCSCINSRKMNIKALLCLEVQVKEIRDEEIITAIEQEQLEQRQVPLLCSNLVLQRRESLRMKEEIELPDKFPAIEQLLWKSMTLNRWEVKPLEDRIVIQWECSVFILYKALSEQEEIKSYETKIKNSINLECEGSHSGMTDCIIPKIKNWGIQVKEDRDGEDRILEAEMNFEPEIKLYEEVNIPVLTDVYGIQEEITPVFRLGVYGLLREKQQSRLKLNKNLRIPASFPPILQVCHIHTGNICWEISEQKEENFVEGTVPLYILYMSEKEEEPFACLKEELSFQYKIEDKKEGEELSYEICALVQEVKATILDQEEMEIKCSLYLEVWPMEEGRREYVEGIERKELPAQKRNKMPGMVVYRATEEENIWEIGKRYYVSLESIRSVNQLESDMLCHGEKILLIR